MRGEFAPGKDAVNWYNIGITYHNSGHYDQAIRCYDGRLRPSRDMLMHGTIEALRLRNSVATARRSGATTAHRRSTRGMLPQKITEKAHREGRA